MFLLEDVLASLLLLLASLSWLNKPILLDSTKKSFVILVT